VNWRNFMQPPATTLPLSQKAAASSDHKAWHHIAHRALHWLLPPQSVEEAEDLQHNATCTPQSKAPLTHKTALPTQQRVHEIIA
jgi:hypothetical protein